MLTVKYIGMKNRIDEIERRIEKAKGTPPFPVRLEIVDNPEDILKQDINKIPTVLADDKIISEGRLPHSKKLKQVFDEFFTIGKVMKTINQKNIDKILVPMDQSDAAAKALKYAKELATRVGATLNIIHVGSAYIDTSQPLLPQTMEDLRQVRIKQLKKLVKPVFPNGKYPPVMYELGFPIDVITEASANYDLVVMGSTGEHGFLDRVLGSISSGVAQKAQCPVLLIPKEYEMKSSGKILCACDPDNMYEDIVDKLLELSMDEDYQEIHFVEIVPPGERGNKKLSTSLIEEVLKNNYEDIHFHVDQVESDSIIEGLKKYAEEEEIGFIVMVTEHRKPLAALFHKSQTKKMVMDIDTPLLILHARH